MRVETAPCHQPKPQTQLAYRSITLQYLDGRQLILTCTWMLVCETGIRPWHQVLHIPNFLSTLPIVPTRTTGRALEFPYRDDRTGYMMVMGVDTISFRRYGLCNRS
jgi:hypothetical protein